MTGLIILAAALSALGFMMTGGAGALLRDVDLAIRPAWCAEEWVFEVGFVILLISLALWVAIAVMGWVDLLRPLHAA